MARSVDSMICAASFGNPASSNASRTMPASVVVELMASLPPRRMTALPDLMHSAAMSIVTFGRLS